MFTSAKTQHFFFFLFLMEVGKTLSFCALYWPCGTLSARLQFTREITCKSYIFGNVNDFTKIGFGSLKAKLFLLQFYGLYLFKYS